jgi:hypothetical protein
MVCNSTLFEVITRLRGGGISNERGFFSTGKWWRMQIGMGMANDSFAMETNG